MWWRLRVPYGMRTLFRRKVEEQLDAELEFHLAMATERRVAWGATQEEARRDAERDFRDLASIKSECRSVREDDPFVVAMLAMRETVARVRRRPVMALRLVTSLTAAISVCTVAALALLATTAPRLPYESPRRLVRLHSLVPGIDSTVQWGLAKGQFLLIQERSRQLAAVALYTLEETVLASADGERIAVARISSSTFDVLSATPFLGRPMVPADNALGAEPVVLLSHDMWSSRYAGDSLIVGQFIAVGSERAHVIGVLPSTARIPEEIAHPELVRVGMWMPLTLDASEPAKNHHVFRGVARAADGASLSQIQEELASLTSELRDVHPDAYPASFLRTSRFQTTATPLLPSVAPGGVSPPWHLAAVAVVLLLLACHAAGAALPDLSAGDARSEHSALQGAHVGDVSGHTADALVLAGTSGLAGLAVTGLFVGGASWWRLYEIPAALMYDHRLLFAVALTSLASGALMLVALGARDRIRLLAAPRALPPGTVATFARAAVALLLLFTAVLQLRSYETRLLVNPGFDVGAVMVTRVTVSAPDSGSGDESLLNLLGTLRSAPGVEAVALTSALPLSGYDGCSAVTAAEGAGQRCVGVAVVTGDYFEALSIPVRGQDWRDEAVGAGKVAVVSESFARRTWPDRDAIGQALWVGDRSDGTYRVLGIASDVQGRDLTHPDREQVYVPLTSRPFSVTGSSLSSVTLVMKSRAPLGEIRALLVAEDRRLGAALALGEPRAMTDLLAESLADTRHAAAALALLGVVALLITLFAAAPPGGERWRSRTASRPTLS